MGKFIENNLDILYWITIIMLIVATIIILGFAIIQMINNKKAAKKSLLTGGGLIIVLLISYHIFASDEVLASYKKYNVDAATSNMVGMGIWSFYILSLLAVSSIVYTEFSKKFLK
tara:strand:- start:32 stop:376 length:345 start_codon:yes stop_codon:yes gene_type:complete